MDLFPRLNALPFRDSKIAYSWLIAYFDGEMPSGWDTMPYANDVDCKNIFENCKAAQLVSTATDDESLKLNNVNHSSSYIGFKNFSPYDSELFIATPTKIYDDHLYLNPIALNSYFNFGRDFLLTMATSDGGNGAFYPMVKDLDTAEPLVYEYAQDISPKKLLIGMHSDYRHTLRDFAVDAYDSETETWVELIVDDIYSRRGSDILIDLPQSTSNKYRVRFLQTTNTNQNAYYNKLLFLVDEIPTDAETFTPTWAIVMPTRQDYDEWSGTMPMCMLSVSDVSGSGDLIVDRSSYELGQPVIALNASLRIEPWESVV